MMNPINQMIAEAINSQDPAHNVALVCTEIVRGLSFIAHAIPDKEEQEAFIETVSKQIHAELEILNQSTTQFEA
jgi:hypothetical protein